MDRKRLFEIIYALAARDGRQEVLFGDTFSVAKEAFSKGLCGTVFPELWLELPLAGTPWFDLHMLVSRTDMYEGVTFAGLDGAYASALSWFAKSSDTRQLALSFDTSVGNVDCPAIQLLLDRENREAASQFLDSCGRADLVGSYQTFVKDMPRDWYACYSGVFPARQDANWVRVECLTSEDAQRVYAHDPNALRAHFARVGLADVDDALVACACELARSQFPLEFQFNVGPEGRALPTVGMSLRFQPEHWTNAGSVMEILGIAKRVEAWGLADGRWNSLAGTIFAQGAKQGDESCHIWCFPAFIKLRWHEDQPLDAKAYLMAKAEER